MPKSNPFGLGSGGGGGGGGGSSRNNPFGLGSSGSRHSGGSTLRDLEDEAGRLGDKAKKKDEGLFSRVARTLTENPASSIVLKALTYLDKPRSAVVSTIAELDDAIEGKGFSGKDWNKQVGRNMGFGELLAREQAEGNAKVGKSNWGNRGIGFLGDVIFDPLTYLTFGASAATKPLSVGGKTIKTGTKIDKATVARVASEAGRTDVAEKVLRRGPGALTRPEARELGIRTGVAVRGFKPVPGTGAGSRAVSGSVGVLSDKVKGAPVIRHLGNMLDPLSPGPGTKNPLRRSDPLAYLELRASKRLGSGLAAGQADAAAKEIKAALKGIDKQAAAAGLRGLGDEAAMPLRQAADGILGRARVAAPEGALPTLDEHLSLWNEVQVYAKTGDDKGLVRSAKRLVQNEGKFLDVRLERGNLDEIERVLKDTLGGRWKTVVQRDPGRVLGTYVNAVHDGLEKSLFRAGLAERGLTVAPEAVPALVRTKAAETAPGVDAALRGAQGREATADVAGAVATEQGREMSRLARIKPTTAIPDAPPGAAPLEALKARQAVEQVAWENASTSETRRNAKKRLKRLSEKVEAEQAVYDGHLAAYGDATTAKQKQETLIAAIEGEIVTARGARQAALEAERDLREEAARLFGVAAEDDGVLGQIAKMEGTASKQAADGAGKNPLTYEAVGWERISKQEEEIADLLHDGFRSTIYGNDAWATDGVADALKDMTEAFGKKGQISALVKAHDAVIGRWKSWSLLSPGFHIRNYYGGMFNNALAGVRIDSYYRFGKAEFQHRKGGLEAIKDPELREAYEAFLSVGAGRKQGVRDVTDIQGGFLEGGNIVNFATGGRLKGAPLSRANRRVGQEVEHLLRGPLFLQYYMEQGGLDAALGGVAKYHFDYDELSQIESRLLRRVIPFYTWQRKNFPLQLEQILRQPGKYTAYLHFKRNLEQGTEEDSLTPKFYFDVLAIRTPWLQNKEGESKPVQPFLAPDLPFRDLATTLSVPGAASQLNPLIRVPLELSQKRRFTDDGGYELREDLDEAPNWIQRTGLGEVLSRIDLPGVPKTQRREDGVWLMSDRDLYMAEASIPTLGRLRRLYGNTDKDQARARSAYLSILMGVSTYQLDDRARKGELYRRMEVAQQELKNWDSLNPSRSETVQPGQ